MAQEIEKRICLICGHARRDDVRPHYLAHGVELHLCATHRSRPYLTRNGGEPFTHVLEQIWDAAGVLTRRRLRALARHRHSVQTTLTRRPGSYAWPTLRQTAERRFADGEDPTAVIADLLTRHHQKIARAPSARTMRRWFNQARWLHPPSPGEAAPTTTKPVRQPRQKFPDSPGAGSGRPTTTHPQSGPDLPSPAELKTAVTSGRRR